MDLELWKKRKKELKINYDELAKKSGVSKRTIEDIFRGFTPNPRIDTVEAIERALGFDKQPDFVYEIEPNKYIIIEMMSDLSDSAVEDIRKYVEYIKDRESKGKNHGK